MEVLRILVRGINKLIRDSRITNPQFQLCFFCLSAGRKMLNVRVVELIMRALYPENTAKFTWDVEMS